MPAPKKITIQQREALKYYLERLSGVRIEHSYHCMDLSNYLQKKHKINVSESTLKRIFGMVKSTDSASVYTLNLLVSAFGFSSWKTFTQEINSIDIQSVNMLLIHRISGQKDFPITNAYFLNQLDISQWTGAYQLHFLIESAVRLEDEKLLNQILELPVEQTEASTSDKLYFALQPIAVYAELQNKFIINWVKKNIADSKILQKYVLQGNVFDTKLLGFYGEWLIQVPENYPEDMPLFKSILLCQMAYLKNDIDQAKANLDKAKFWESHLRDKISPILKGRLAAWNYILEGDLNLLATFYGQEPSLIAKIELLEFASRLIWQYTTEKQQLPFINELDLDEFPVFTSFYQKGRCDVMRLVKAINLFNAEKITEAKNLLSDINPINFHFSDREWLQGKYQQILIA
jgi:hypothetical protein